ncbi:MAG: O-antigen ligase family protein [Fimbriimonadaceae bacterium]|nr:O-antigen ligase family protein [Fimbriimonadaceae bacterium]
MGLACPSASALRALALGVGAAASGLLLLGATFRTFLIDPDLAALTVGALLLLAAAALIRWRGATPYTALAAAAFGWALGAAATAVNPRCGWEGALWAGLAVGLVAAGQLLARPTWRDAAGLGLLVAAWPVAALAVAEAGGWRAPETLYLTEFGQPRALSTLNHPNNYAGFVALLLPWAAGWALAGAGERRFGLAACSGLLAVALAVGGLATYSKGGQLASLLAVAVLLAWLPPAGWRAWWRASPRRAALLGAAAGLLLVVLALLFWHSAAASRLRLFVELLPTLAKFQRIGTWLAGWQMLLADPLSGVGPGCFGVAMAWYRPATASSEMYTHAHNWYLQVAAEQGLPGLLLLLLLLLQAVRGAASRAAQTSGPARWREAGLHAGLIGFAAAGLLDYNVGVPAIAVVWWFLAGLAATPPAAPRPGRWRWPVLLALLLLTGPWLLWNRGQAAYLRCLHAVAAGQWEPAARELAAAQGLDPQQRAYHLVACDLLLWTGQRETARARLQALAAEQPLESWYAARLAWLLPRADGLRTLAAAVQRDPAEPALRTELAWLQAQTGDPDQRLLTAAAAATPDATGARAMLGETAWQHGDPAGAATWLAAGAAAADPRDRPARFLMAYGRLDPAGFVPLAQRQRLLDQRVRYHGAILPRWRLRISEAAARAAAGRPAPAPAPRPADRR